MDGHARQADPGHGTVVETAVLGSGTCAVEGGKAGVGHGVDDWWLRAYNGLERRWEWHGHAFGGLVVAQGDRARQALRLEGRGKAFGTVTEDEASPPPPPPPPPPPFK